MKRKLLLALLILISGITVLKAQVNHAPLTHEMTPEEELRRNEIGRDFIITDPAAPPVRMLAEFEQMQSVLVRYPFGIPMSLIVEMSQDCKVKTIVADAATQQIVTNQYQSAGVNMANCEWLIAPSDSYWTRDYGPWFVVDGSYDMGITDFIYNRPRPNDDNIPNVLAQQMGIPRYGMALTTAGGNYMCDGLGVAASTDLILEENASMSEAEIDTMVKDYLGIRKYNILPDPLGEYIKHIDCWGKFLDVDKVLIGQVPVSDYRYADFEYVANYFAMQTSSWGDPYKVYRVYTPGDYPYTPYTNSLILNKKVFVPQTGSQWDDEALVSYQEAMPGYEVVGVLFNTWENTDALHCRAIGIGDPDMLYVYHMPILGNKNFRLSWNLEADIIPYSGSAVKTDSLLCYYQFNGGDYQATPLQHTAGYHYTATIPFAEPGTEVGYYIHAADYSGRKMDHPYIGAPDPHVFKVKYANDLVVDPDSLIFLTFEDMMNGKTFNMYNYTDGDLVITDIEPEGYHYFYWHIDPLNVITPDTMAYGEVIPVTVKVDIPINLLPGQMVVDTMDIYTETGHHKVIIKVDEDLINGIQDPAPVVSTARIDRISPNPFSETTRISFTLDKPQHATVAIYNIQGQMVELLTDQVIDAGSHDIYWNGSRLPDGVYFVRMISEGGNDSERLVHIR